MSDRQAELLSREKEATGPVECLGMTFANDKERREYFLEKLREKLQDSEFRRIEGFPIGSDDDILALSDPPYYTACPNPFLDEFVEQFARRRGSTESYAREPFAADVTEGKHDPIYRAHPFHTKVPHRAVMRYVLHYTSPGDVVFDGFCGTGMTGVAAQLCADKDTVESLGYRVKGDGKVFKEEIDPDGKRSWVAFSEIGTRPTILSDLSPVASTIAHCYTNPIDAADFETKAIRALEETEAECAWLFETMHDDGRKGEIVYVVWSDVFACPECADEIVFFDTAIDSKTQKVLDSFGCPSCSALLTKRKLERSWTTHWDSTIEATVKQTKSVPVSISYRVGTQRFEKRPEKDDVALFDKIEREQIPYPYPSDRMMEGKESRRNDPVGITHVHHFYTKQNLWFFAAFFARVSKYRLPIMVFTGPLFSACKMYRWTPNYEGGGPLSGTLFVPSLIRDISAPSAIRRFVAKLPALFAATRNFEKNASVKACASLTDMRSLPDASVDYCFIDPPFGANLNYSELNYLWESWLGTWTNIGAEAIENSAHGKGLDEYRRLMTRCFQEAHRVLKPGRWMTVEFSNTKATVWNSIQTALSEAGFIVANVSALDKKHGSFKAITTPTAVKQDLVISVYKPNGGFEERFEREANSPEGVWDFVRTHLGYLPVVKRQEQGLTQIVERDPRVLFDQMVAYFVQKGLAVPLSSQEFQQGLLQRFSERDGMIFLPEQASEYDRIRVVSSEITQQELFVSDESSAIQWLKHLLITKPRTFQDLNPLFIKELAGWQKYEKPLELSELLEQNFLHYDGKGEVPSQIHSYLSSNFREMRNLSKDDPDLRVKGKDRWYLADPNKAGDLERLRERALLREFDDYRESKQKRLKIFRIEAIRAGFKKAWQERDYSTIIAMARKIPENVLQEDPKLLMWFDQALTRTGEDG